MKKIYSMLSNMDECLMSSVSVAGFDGMPAMLGRTHLCVRRVVLDLQELFTLSRVIGVGLGVACLPRMS